MTKENLKWMKISEVGEKYGVSRQAVYNWIEQGLKYKVLKEVGKKPYKVINNEELESFLNHGLRG